MSERERDKTGAITDIEPIKPESWLERFKRRSRGDFSDVNPNIMKMSTVCRVVLYGLIGLTGMYVGLSMVYDAARDIPKEYVDIVIKAAAGGVISMGVMMGGGILAISATRDWPRR